MNNLLLEPSVLHQGAPALVLDANRCACGHPQTEHDAVGLRYCKATSAAALTRGCICRSAPAKRDR